MKAIVTTTFRDKISRAIHFKGEIVTLTDERYAEIQKAGHFVQPIIEQVEQQTDTVKDQENKPVEGVDQNAGDNSDPSVEQQTDTVEPPVKKSRRKKSETKDEV